MPAPIARSVTRNWSRAVLVSTAPTAPVRSARVFARVAFDPELVIPKLELSLADGAIVPWRDASPAALRKLKQQLRDWMAAAGFRWNTPLEKLKPKTREELLHGDGKEFLGVLVMLEKEYVTTISEPKRQRLEAFRGEVICTACKGAPAAARGPRGPHRRPGHSRSHGALRSMPPGNSSSRSPSGRSSSPSPRRSSARSWPG